MSERPTGDLEIRVLRDGPTVLAVDVIRADPVIAITRELLANHDPQVVRRLQATGVDQLTIGMFERPLVTYALTDTGDPHTVTGTLVWCAHLWAPGLGWCTRCGAKPIEEP
jgi:hypothetical protein